MSGASNLSVRRQQADDERGATHDHQCHQERVFPPHEVADAPEEQRAEGARGKPCGKRGQCREHGQRLITRREELGRQNEGEAAEDVEVVPLDHRADARGADDHPDIGSAQAVRFLHGVCWIRYYALFPHRCSPSSIAGESPHPPPIRSLAVNCPFSPRSVPGLRPWLTSYTAIAG
jgi:hypothetical protein